MNAERRDDRVLLLLQICCFSFVLLFVDATHANLGETTFTVQTTARVSGDVREGWDGGWEAGARGEAEERSSGLRGYLVEGQREGGSRLRGARGITRTTMGGGEPTNQPTNRPTVRTERIPGAEYVCNGEQDLAQENAKNPFIHIITLLFVVIPPKFVPHALREGLLYRIGRFPEKLQKGGRVIFNKKIILQILGLYKGFFRTFKFKVQKFTFFTFSISLEGRDGLTF